MNNVLLPLLTCIAGAGIGFLLTRLNDWIVERRELRRSSRHLRTETANVVRHYTMMQEKLSAYETESPWRNDVHLESCRIFGNGLGTFDMATLRLFDASIAEEALYLMLMVRNNNSYIDQAIKYNSPDAKEQFQDVCQELIQRFPLTIERARRLETMLKVGGPGGEPSRGRAA